MNPMSTVPADALVRNVAGLVADAVLATQLLQICLASMIFSNLSVTNGLLLSRAKYGMKLLIHSQTSTVQPLKFENW